MVTRKTPIDRAVFVNGVLDHGDEEGLAGNLVGLSGESKQKAV